VPSESDQGYSNYSDGPFYSRRRSDYDHGDDSLLTGGQVLTEFQLLQVFYTIRQQEIASNLHEIAFLRLSNLDRVNYILNLVLQDQQAIVIRVGDYDQLKKLSAREILNLHIHHGVTHLVAADKRNQKVILFEVIPVELKPDQVIPQEFVLDEVISISVAQIPPETINDSMYLFKEVMRQFGDATQAKVDELLDSDVHKIRKKQLKRASTFDETWGAFLNDALGDFK
jgi:hypothetical protein